MQLEMTDFSLVQLYVSLAILGIRAQVIKPLRAQKMLHELCVRGEGLYGPCLCVSNVTLPREVYPLTSPLKHFFLICFLQGELSHLPLHQSSLMNESP